MRCSREAAAEGAPARDLLRSRPVGIVPWLAPRDDSADVLERVLQAVGRALPEAGLPRDAVGQPVLAFVALYREGIWLGRGAAAGATRDEALAGALHRACSASDLAPTTVVVVLPRQLVGLDGKSWERVTADIHRGILGAGFWREGQPFLVSPTDCVGRNLPLDRLLEELAEQAGLDVKRLMREGRAFSFLSDQYLVRFDQAGAALRLLRGCRLVEPGEVTWDRLLRFERDLSAWMLRSVQDDGRMTYAYLPSRTVEGRGNNMVRQFMATVCLGRIAERRLDLPGARAAEDAADLNLRYNLRHFYRQEGEHGLIVNGRNAYLGSAALALIGIIESPRRAELLQEERGLRATIDSLWHSNGAFTTWIRPAARKDNQNYFPGEALLAWAFLLEDSTGEARALLLERILKSYRFYRRWHLARRSPAFVPWHTQAYFRVLRAEPHQELVDWVFEMNDWTLGMQACSQQGYEDTLGRFYDPQQPFGPPHASSTGVYLEGLVDAFALARQAGDARRARAYRKAILLGLRSTIQLQFADEDSLFFVSDRDRVRGGVKTTVYNNAIRVDNVQHTLMAVQKILQTLTPEDFPRA